jgi:NitT/TauT family transport system ATP-binding protein
VNGSEPPLIEFRGVDVAFGDHLVLGKLSLEVRRGEIVCVVGPSGCGKTTALRVASGLIHPTRGEVAFAGAPIKGPRRDVAVVFQDYSKALLPWRTAAGNVALALEATGTPRGERPNRIARLLTRVGLAAFAEKYPSQMSGGMQQRLQIARCLAQEPSALMMDEPFGALDAMTRQTLQDQILDIARATNATIFFVTHDLEEAIYLGDRVIGLMPHPGRVGLDVTIDLPRPRNQVLTRESPEFLKLRRALYDFIHASEATLRL